MKRFSNHKGFSLLDVFLILVALAGIILVLLPSFARSHQRSAKASCVNHLKQVSLAFRIWAGDNGDKYPTQLSITNGGAMEWAEAGSAYGVFLVMSNYLSTPKVLFCPEENNRSRVVATTFGFTPAPESTAVPISFAATNNLSYFVGLDAVETQPNTILTGDDHLQVRNVPPRPGLLLLATNTPVAWAKGRHQSSGNKPGGNLGMADGSVHQVLSAQLQSVFDGSGFATNRLAMP